MDVFVIPIGPERYELYCELAAEPEATTDDAPPSGVVGRLRHRFNGMLRAAEARQYGGEAPPEGQSVLARAQDRIVAWAAERIAEQRLLWNLRRVTAARVIHPEDLAFDQTMALLRRTLSRDYDRHQRWLVIDTLGLIVSAALMLLPGPNVVAYYFAFRVVGHWLSMRGARQGLRVVTWTGESCAPLSELRRAAILEPEERERRVHEVGERLHLQHLHTFFERVAITRA